MDTYFAPAEKADECDLRKEIETVSKSPLLSGLLHCVGGLLAILNEHRQVIGINDTFLKMLGIEDPATALGLRPGEALQCSHANEEPAGCGTTRFCSTCGAAIAIVASMGQDEPVERLCALSRGTTDMALLVRSQPVKIDGKRFLLLFLQDITAQQQKAALERTFFHDVNNMLAMLIGTSELLVMQTPSELAEIIQNAALRLHKEVLIQRSLSQSGEPGYKPVMQNVEPERIMEELQSFFVNHPAAYKKRIECRNGCPGLSLKTDTSLLSRILCNMVVNGLEATEENGIVKVWVEQDGASVSFCVWNDRAIPDDITTRIFQRNFSTKGQAGRGVGTFSMKLFGERVLGGKVRFTTSQEKGTVFRFTLPL